MTTIGLLGHSRDDEPATSRWPRVGLIGAGLRYGWDLGGLDLRHVSEIVTGQGFTIDAKSGRVTRQSSDNA